MLKAQYSLSGKTKTKTNTMIDFLKLFEDDIDLEDIDPLKSQKTQRGRNTRSTYRELYDFLTNNFPEGPILDFGAGDGTSSLELELTSYEPHPPKGFDPMYSKYDDLAASGEKFMKVICVHVLNVVPPPVRSDICQQIRDVIDTGGAAVICARSVSAVATAKTATPIDNVEQGAVFNKSGTYQKGFRPEELRSYLQNEFGPEFKVSVLEKPYTNSHRVICLVQCFR